MSDRCIEGKSVDDILIDVYDLILNKGQNFNATKGDFIEYDSCLITLTNPLARLSRTDIKQTIFSCLGEFFWYISGSEDANFISYYIKMYSDCAEDDGRIHGAYGPRIFSYDNKFNQFQQVLDRLKNKETTRQAVIQLFGAHDTAKSYNDIPCTLSWQFMIRNGKLNMYVNMRSNDAYRGLPHDLFVFTMVQEIVARELGVELGVYHHYVGSLHIYDKDINLVETYRERGFQAQEPMMSPMPPSLNFTSIKSQVIRIEQEIRSNEAEMDRILDSDLPKYWIDILLLLYSYSQKKQLNDKTINLGEFNSTLREIIDNFDSYNYRQILETKMRREAVKNQ